jgi:hypothetical protein
VTVQRLDEIRVAGGRRVELLQGDLSNLPRREWFDAIVVSAFNRNYYPSSTSLIGALDRRGISVEELAATKEDDHTEQLGTWLSAPVHATDRGIGFERVICFEPMQLGSPPQVVGHLFRALTSIVGGHQDIRTIAMPILATGNMGYAVEEMLPPLLDAAVNWLDRGRLIDRLAIVVYSDADAGIAQQIFERAKRGFTEYDVFVSYAHEDSDLREHLSTVLRSTRPETTFFVDREQIDNGAAWQRKIFESLDRCKLVVALMTPDYLRSEVCLEEYNIAWMRGRREGRPILRPLFVSGVDLPTYMDSLNYQDCRERDRQKLADAAAELARFL